MSRFHQLSLIAVLGLALMATSAPAAAQSLDIQTADGAVRTLDAAALSTLPRTRVTLSLHGDRHVFEGPLLMDVLRQTGVKSGTQLRGPALAQAVTVRASDGYAVVFGLAELDPNTRSDRIILADTVDGAPLSETDGPYRVVAENDLRPARSARQVIRIEVTRLGPDLPPSLPSAANGAAQP